MSSQQSKALRSQLGDLHRIVIKCGTSVVSHRSGEIALGRVANVVEQVVELIHSGKQVLLVSSGAVSVGRQKLRTAQLQSQSVFSYVRGCSRGMDADPFEQLSAIQDSRACAAAGQSGLVNLYEVMFGQYGVQCAQVLVANDDFVSPVRRENIRNTLNQLMSVGIVPILNENDATSGRMPQVNENEDRVFWDNDSLAAHLATEIRAELLIILSDIDGLFRKNPAKHPNQNPISLVVVHETDQVDVEFGEKSGNGRGGMEAKLAAVYRAVRGGVPFVFIASGYAPHTVSQLFQGEPIGTLFTEPFQVSKTILHLSHPDLFTEHSQAQLLNSPEVTRKNEHSLKLRDLAVNARQSSRWVRCLSGVQRATLLDHIAKAIDEQRERIFQQNQLDWEALSEQSASLSRDELKKNENLLQRLKLTEEKINAVIEGLRSLSNRLRGGRDPLQEILTRTEVSPGLELVQCRSPIGVLLVIFESRPEVLPQVAGLSVCSGNAVILKGGKEASRSNEVFVELISQGLLSGVQELLQKEGIPLLPPSSTLNGRKLKQKRAFHSSSIAQDSSQNSPIALGSDPKLVTGLLGFVSTREDVTELLEIGEKDSLIDMVIPRGGNALVQHIKSSTSLPVLGHADGICHVYVHSDCELEKAIRVVIDSKVDYPAACNAVECLLVQRELFVDGRADALISALRENNVEIFTGTRAHAYLGNEFPLATSMSQEYGELKITLEMVDHPLQAFEFINMHGSGHTDCIVTENAELAERFLESVDSACVFWNCSTRFADGYRFGLGAEVGISTNRIHARGPVGLEGLTITKWKLVSSSAQAHCVADFRASNPDHLTYTHKILFPSCNTIHSSEIDLESSQ